MLSKLYNIAEQYTNKKILLFNMVMENMGALA